ncbi:MAG TPA: BrnA antitoxin family protein [Brevundimonas sp.]|jgi:uncharacterized protein (DUF4415 family)|uniref:BrnA antitoxin family protein n=1 Tax=Brevundimonas sp. TaxID=1871086 RepID=UPI002E0F73C5|nr:BrnA antitoxin family protein [Brevundimonas sp.]
MADPKFSLDPDDYEDVDIDDPDNPEWTEEDFAEARPLKEVLPELYEQVAAQQDVSLKLTRRTIAAFALEGDDWRERMAEALERIARDKSAA